MLSAGTRLGPYEILSPLGAGGMGEVYRAQDSKLQRDVAIKVLPQAVAPSRRGRASKSSFGLRPRVLMRRATPFSVSPWRISVEKRKPFGRESTVSPSCPKRRINGSAHI